MIRRQGYAGDATTSPAALTGSPSIPTAVAPCSTRMDGRWTPEKLGILTVPPNKQLLSMGRLATTGRSHSVSRRAAPNQLDGMTDRHQQGSFTTLG